MIVWDLLDAKNNEQEKFCSAEYVIVRRAQCGTIFRVIIGINCNSVSVFSRVKIVQNWLNKTIKNELKWEMYFKMELTVHEILEK